ncbi:MAG: hypothetical protein H5T99_04200, partial [Moorella sp. (in: Bacteria)]|nr:hypothetical protein [Moorella sp. (in: firmicutes)]
AILPYLRQVRDAVEQEAYVRLLSRQTGISEAAILGAIRQAPPGRGRTGSLRETGKAGAAAGGRAMAELTCHGGELFLLQAYLASPGLAARIDRELGEDWGETPAARSLIAGVRERRREAPQLAGTALARALAGRGGEEENALIARLALSGGPDAVPERALQKAIDLYRLQQLQKKEREIRLALARAENSGATGRVRELQGQIFHLQQAIKLIKSGRGE